MKLILATLVVFFALAVPARAQNACPVPNPPCTAICSVCTQWINPNTTGTVAVLRAGGACPANLNAVSWTTLTNTAPLAGPFVDVAPPPGTYCYVTKAIVNGTATPPSNTFQITVPGTAVQPANTFTGILVS